MRRLQVFLVCWASAGALLWWLFRTGSPPTQAPHAQSRPVGTVERPIPIDALMKDGESRYWAGAFDSARALWTQALDRSRRGGDRQTEARALTWLGLVAYRTSDYVAARRDGEAALAIKLGLGPGAELARSYNALGLLAWQEGRLDEATARFGQAMASAAAERDPDLTAKAANNLGLVYSDRGEFARARESFQASLQAGVALSDELIQGRVLNNLGMLELRTGDPAAGLEALEQARHHYQKRADVTGELNTLGQLAVAYMELGRPARAFGVLDTAVALAHAHDNPVEEASARELLGDLYSGAGDHRRSLVLYRQAEQTYRTQSMAIEEGAALIRQAHAYTGLADTVHALALTETAVALHQEAGARVEALNDLLLVAELASFARLGAKSEAALRRATALTRKLDTRAARVALALTEARIADHQADPVRVFAALRSIEPDLRNVSYGEVAEFEALRARAYARAGNLAKAAVSGSAAVEALARVRERLATGYLRSTFSVDQRTASGDLIDVLRRLGRDEDAFEVADAARGDEFRAHLTSVPDGRANTTVERLRDGERLLRGIDELMALRHGLEALPPDRRGASTARQAAELEEKLAKARDEYEEFVLRGEEASARAGIALPGQRIKAAEVRHALRAGEALLEITASGNHFVAFVATASGVQSVTLRGTTGDILRQARLSRELSGRSRTLPSPTPVLERLYQSLIEPVSAIPAFAQAGRLIIVPDAALDHVPLAALRDPGTGKYLAERYVISYLPSAAMLPALRAEPNVRRPSERRGPMVTVLVPLPDQLPGTRLEAGAVRQATGPTLVLEGQDATEQALRQALETSEIVHVASHAAVDGQNPFFSRLELARSGGDPGRDGRLELHEVLGLAVASQLVFLSGCETASGLAGSSTYAGGSGFATLARAFLEAGARGVIATLWRIDDAGAAEFAASFYRHLRNESAELAVTMAQRELIQSARYRTPYYWAAYRLTGVGRPGAPAATAGVWTR